MEYKTDVRPYGRTCTPFSVLTQITRPTVGSIVMFEEIQYRSLLFVWPLWTFIKNIGNKNIVRDHLESTEFVKIRLDKLSTIVLEVASFVGNPVHSVLDDNYKLQQENPTCAPTRQVSGFSTNLRLFLETFSHSLSYRKNFSYM